MTLAELMITEQSGFCVFLKLWQNEEMRFLDLPGPIVVSKNTTEKYHLLSTGLKKSTWVGMLNIFVVI